MFTILDGRKHFYQWDIDRKLIVADKSIEEVHFSNRADGEALICATYLQGDVLLVDVPNILLQDNWRISAYAYDENHTRFEETYDVKKRSKPADYVYTETEVKNYDDLTQRIEQIEENGISDEAVENAVEKYLEENDIKVDLTGYATEQYVQEQINNIDIPETDLTGYATEDFVKQEIEKIDIPSTEGLATEKYVDDAIANIDIPEPEGSVEEVYVGKEAPTDENIKIWVDIDAESPVATKEYVAQKIAEAQLSGDDNEVDLSGYYTKTETDAAIKAAQPDLSGYAKKSEIPSTAGFATEQYVQNEIAKIEIPEGGSDVDLSNYYTKSEVDEKTGYTAVDIAARLPDGMGKYFTLDSETANKLLALPDGKQVEVTIQPKVGGELFVFKANNYKWSSVAYNGFYVSDEATGFELFLVANGTNLFINRNGNVYGKNMALTIKVTGNAFIEMPSASVDLSNYYTKDETTAAINEALSAIGNAEEVSF